LIDRSKPMLKLGLDVHLEFIMAVVQRGHLGPQAPRKFTRVHSLRPAAGIVQINRARTAVAITFRRRSSHGISLRKRV
jgi:hypothetical protein